LAKTDKMTPAPTPYHSRELLVPVLLNSSYG
jgi:hypothetical protein